MFFFCLFSFCVTKTNRRNGESPYNPTRFSVILRSFCTSHYSKQENQENEREKKHNQPKTVQFCPYEMHNANRNRQPTVVFLWFVYVISVHTREHTKKERTTNALQQMAQTEQTIKLNTQNKSKWFFSGLCTVCLFDLVYGARARAREWNMCEIVCFRAGSNLSHWSKWCVQPLWAVWLSQAAGHLVVLARVTCRPKDWGLF